MPDATHKNTPRTRGSRANANGSRSRGPSSKATGSETPAPAEVTRKRERQAEQARAKAQERGEGIRRRGLGGRARLASGISSGPDYGFLELTKYAWNPLMDYWFRMEIEGWEHIPPAPALLIGIHSGAPFVWDAWTVGVQWWRHFGR